MIRMEKQTLAAPQQVIDQAVAFFGPGGFGLEVKECSPYCTRFEGGGGYVDINVTDCEDEPGSEVEIEGREWERQIREFLAEI